MDRSSITSNPQTTRIQGVAGAVFETGISILTGNLRENSGFTTLAGFLFEVVF